MKKTKEIGIIGYGRFGKLLAKYLKEDFVLSIYDKNILSAEIKKNSHRNIHFSTLKEVAGKDIVILTVPISALLTVLKEIGNYVKKDALFIDVCSVKEYPIKLMKRLLPKKVQILGTHPLFGPDSASDTLKGKKIILCPVSISKSTYTSIKEYLNLKKLILIEKTPKEHDKQTAWTLCLTHFIGHTLAKVNIIPRDLDTLTFRELLHIKDTVTNDTSELFFDMQTYNRFAGAMRNKVEKSMRIILNQIESFQKTKLMNKNKIQKDK